MAFSFKKTFPATWWLLASRHAHILYLCLIGAVALMLVGIHVDALIFRYRAERLLHEIQALPLGQRSFAEAKEVLNKYPQEAQVHGECQPSDCGFEITLSHLWEPRPYEMWGPFGSRTGVVLRSAQVVGLRPASVRAWVGVREGVVQRKSFQLEFLSRDGIPEAAGARTVGTLGLDRSREALDNAWFDAHPDMTVSAWLGKGAAGADFTPYASVEEIQKAMTFDLSCFSRWFRPCLAAEEVATGAVQLREEAARALAGYLAGQGTERNPSCPPTKLVRYGRESPGIALLRVKRAGRLPPTAHVPEELWSVDYELVETLKDRRGRPHAIFLNSVRVRPSVEMFTPGKTVISFFYLGWPSWRADCGVVPATEENLRAVKEGIAQDNSF